MKCVHIDGKHNPADVAMKHLSSREWYELMKPLIFWRVRDNETSGSHRGEGSVTVSPLVTEGGYGAGTESTILIPWHRSRDLVELRLWITSSTIASQYV